MPLLMVLATQILGFGVKLFPSLSGAEFRINELLERDHIAAGSAIALTINAVLSPPGVIVVLRVLLVLFAFVLIVRRSPVNAFAVAFGIAIYFLARGARWAVWVAIIGLGFALLVATAAICFYTGLWNRYGMRILNQIPFLDRIGPIPLTNQPSGHRTTSPAPAPDAR